MPFFIGIETNIMINLTKLRLAMILQTWSRNVLVKKCPLVEKCRSGNVFRSRSVSVKKWGSRNVGRKMSGRDLSLHVRVPRFSGDASSGLDFSGE